MSCAFTECERVVKAKGLCGAHYEQQRRGSPLMPIRSMSPRGSGHRNGQGYVRRYMPGHPMASAHGFVIEHRLVMSDMLGRPLDRTETVHHRNGKRADNRPDNLELWSKSHPPGQRVTDLVAWAREIIERYGDFVEYHKPVLLEHAG